MATRTKKKAAKKKTAQKTETKAQKAARIKKAKDKAKEQAREQGRRKKAASMKKATGKADLDPDQKQLEGFEGDRIPEVEKLIKEILGKQSTAKTAADDVAMLTSEIPELFAKHKIDKYICLGKLVTIQPGADVVKILKAPKK